MSSVTLDHVGVVTRDLVALAAQYQHLGFQLTPLARQADGRIGNRCAMLRQGYIELLAVVDPGASSATLDRFLARYAGIHILAFAIDDTDAVLARLQRAGIDAPTVMELERPIDDSNAAGPHARFALIQAPDQPEGRINLVHHLTPELLWQERFLHHPNKAVALDAASIVVADPADTAARFSRLIGCVVVPDPAGGFALGRLQILPPDGGLTPRFKVLTLRTSDGNASIGRLVAGRNLAHRTNGDTLQIDPAAAGGVELCFVAAA